jgi:putative colanic acid biosynthesis UDP-glucose lipid carrier transferase
MSQHRFIRQQWNLSTAIYRLMDAISVACGLWFVLRVYPAFDSDATLVVCLAAIGTYMLIGEFTGLYRNWAGSTAEREIGCSLLTFGLTLLVLITIGHFSKSTTELDRSALLMWLAVTPLTSIGGRIVFRLARQFAVRSGWFSRKCAIIGVNDLGVQLARNIFNSSELGLSLYGFYDDRPPERTVQIPQGVEPLIGQVDQLIQAARAGEISTVFIALPMRAEKRINQILSELSDSTASVYIVPDFFVFQLLHSRWTDVHGLPVVSLFENPLYGIDGLAKRMTDLALASLALIVFSLPMLLIGLLIKLTSKGPVFFRQKRYGLDGREILVWKFRSMRVCENGQKVTQATKHDSRVTGLGAILRKTSLDELPQLFNVIGGSMSLVGPRPHASAHNEDFRKRISGYMLRHKIKPGITGLAQVSGWRGETDTLDKMEGRIHCDHQYIREWSLWLDLKILFRTFYVVLKRDNAY